MQTVNWAKEGMESQGHFWKNPCRLISMKPRPRHQVSVYRTNGPLVILAGNDDMHESSKEFKFRPDWTTDCGVSCPWMSDRLIMGKTMPPIFLRCFSCLQVMITYMRAWMSSKFSPIWSGTTELASLEHLKNRCCPFFSFHSCGYIWEIVRWAFTGPLVLWLVFSRRARIIIRYSTLIPSLGCCSFDSIRHGGMHVHLTFEEVDLWKE